MNKEKYQITEKSNYLNILILIDELQSYNTSLSDDNVKFSRNLKKKLAFANHFRNRAVGHLNETLLERAVQWSPQIFSSASKENLKFKIAEAYIVIIEACTNSFINHEGIQKVFNTEIDLMYPPDAELFFTHLQELVTESLEWLTISAESTLSSIQHHDENEIKELAEIAAKTNFNLKEESQYSYPQEEQKVQIQKVIKELEKRGTEKKIIEFIKSQFKS